MLAAGQTQTFGFANGLIDVLGQALQFSAIKVLSDKATARDGIWPVVA